MTFWEYLSWPFAKLMAWYYGLTGNYGLSLILFSLTINLVLAPFMAKSKKSTLRTTRLASIPLPAASGLCCRCSCCSPSTASS